jgi:hypothetical protein
LLYGPLQLGFLICSGDDLSGWPNSPVSSCLSSSTSFWILTLNKALCMVVCPSHPHLTILLIQ